MKSRCFPVCNYCASIKTILCVFFLLCCSIVAAQQQPKPDVLIITIDTLRADRLGCYGYRAAKTPNIDQLASEGVLFSDATSAVPLTRPSHISIFTGLYPFEHGIHDNIAPPVDAKIPLLAELFQKNGYQTAAFVSSFVINAQSGLNRGFDVYRDQFKPEDRQFALNLEKRGDQIYQEFQDWHKQKATKPYFAWVHLYDPHFPYEPPAPYASRFAQSPYDGEIAFADEIVGKIVKLAGSRAMIILTSDHGEGLGEHGESAHSYYIYDATLRVPLIFRWAGELPANKQVKHQVRLIDVFPTILELQNWKSGSKVTGISLKPWLANPDAPDPNLYAYSESFVPWIHFGWSRLQGVRTGKAKYIHAPHPELYDLSKDPQELRNIAATNAGTAGKLKRWLAGSGAMKEEKINPVENLDPETIEKLAALGYAGVASPPPAASGPLADPKDKLEDFKLFNQLIREGIEDFREERYQAAAGKFRQLKDRNVPSFEVHYYLGRSLLRLKSYDNASTELQAAIEKLPHFVPAYRDLAEAYEALGKLPKAEEALRAGLTISPAHPFLVQPLAWLYQKQKKYAPAEELLLATIQAHPDEKDARYRLGAIYRDTNRAQAAREQFREILKQNPVEAEAHNQLGMLSGGSGNFEEALREFREAARLDPGNESYRKNVEIAQSRVSTKEEPIRFRLIQTKSRAAAAVLLKKLAAGAAWEELARVYSIHPSARTADPVLRMQLPELEPEFRDALAAMKPGEVSSIIETPNGFFILLRE